MVPSGKNPLPRYHTATHGAVYIIILGGDSPFFGAWVLRIPRRIGYSSASNAVPLGLSKWKWEPLEATGATPPPLMQHTISSILLHGQHALVVLGGRDPTCLGTPEAESTTTTTKPLRGWLLEINAAVWHPLPEFKGSFPSDRYGHSAIGLDAQTVIVMGGTNASFDPKVYILHFDDFTCSCLAPAFRIPHVFERRAPNRST